MRAADPCLQLGRPLRTESQARSDRLREIRKRWMWHWQNFWMCQFDSSVLTSSWKEENRVRAGQAMRRVVREYAAARGWQLKGKEAA